jgi:hypothetical protein
METLFTSIHAYGSNPGRFPGPLPNQPAPLPAQPGHLPNDTPPANTLTWVP